MACTRSSVEEIHATLGRGTDNLRFTWNGGKKEAEGVARGDTMLVSMSMDRDDHQGEGRGWELWWLIGGRCGGMPMLEVRSLVKRPLAKADYRNVVRRDFIGGAHSGADGRSAPYEVYRMRWKIIVTCTICAWYYSLYCSLALDCSIPCSCSSDGSLPLLPL
jgi:hypothetical protein